MKTQYIKNNTEENVINQNANHLQEVDHLQIAEDFNKGEKGIVKEEKLQQIVSTKKQLAQIKEELDKMIEAFVQNQSILSRAAKFWGGLPWWQKAITGSIIIVPLLVVSIITHILVLTVISIFTLITYVASSFLLDNHYQQTQNDKDDLKKGILGLADTLGTVIESLDQLRQELASEIFKFQNENDYLNKLVEQLSQQVEELKIQVKHLVDVEQQLDITKDNLKKTSIDFANAVEHHTKLLERNKLQLEKTIKDYDECQVQLAAKILELDDVKTQMGLELDQANKISLTLQGTVEELSKTVISDEAQRAEFQERLQEFLADRKKSFDNIVDNTIDVKNKLHAVEEELKLSNERYAELLKRAEGHIDRLEQTFNPSAKLSLPSSPKKLGFFGDHRSNSTVLPDGEPSRSYEMQ